MSHKNTIGCVIVNTHIRKHVYHILFGCPYWQRKDTGEICKQFRVGTSPWISSKPFICSAFGTCSKFYVRDSTTGSRGLLFLSMLLLEYYCVLSLLHDLCVRWHWLYPPNFFACPACIVTPSNCPVSAFLLHVIFHVNVFMAFIALTWPHM